MGDDGAVEYENDLSEAAFDVTVDVGPSSSSKRAAVVRALTGIMSITQDPETLQVLGSMVIENLEGEGLAAVRAWSRKKLLRMGIGKPTDQEVEALQSEAQAQRPDPNAEFLKASALEAQAKAKQAEANAVLTVAKTEQTEAQTQEILAGIPRDDRLAAVDAATKIGKALQ
jgi:hypothetical protein